MSKVIVLIPARYQSTRFPGKPLEMIAKKSMIQRTYEQVLKAKGIDQICVATDDNRILDHVLSFNGNAIMTADTHLSGTDRCFEAATKLGIGENDIVINVQGDEPFISPLEIENLISPFQNKQIDICTAAIPFNKHKELFDPNKVKVIFNTKGKAIYFSRSTIPYVRSCPETEWLKKHPFYKHLGLYAYRMKVLSEITQLPPSPLELIESLEQLRWVEEGYYIHINLSAEESFGIDTPEDLENATKYINSLK